MIIKIVEGCVEYENEEGQLHCEDGPAFSRDDGFKAWYINGVSHREDGPAFIRGDGRKSWFLDGVEVYCFKYSEDEAVKEICIKCKRNTEDGRVGGLEHCPFKMEQIVCKKGCDV